MKIKIIEMNKTGCSTVFSVDGKVFKTSNWGDGLWYNGEEIIPASFFSLNQDTRSGRWKAIRKNFVDYADYINTMTK